MKVVKIKCIPRDSTRGQVLLKANIPVGMPAAIPPVEKMTPDQIKVFAEIGRSIFTHPITLLLQEMNATHIRLGVDAPQSIRIDCSSALG